MSCTETKIESISFFCNGDSEIKHKEFLDTFHAEGRETVKDKNPDLQIIGEHMMNIYQSARDIRTIKTDPTPFWPNLAEKKGGLDRVRVFSRFGTPF